MQTTTFSVIYLQAKTCKLEWKQNTNKCEEVQQQDGGKENQLEKKFSFVSFSQAYLSSEQFFGDDHFWKKTEMRRRRRRTRAGRTNNSKNGGRRAGRRKRLKRKKIRMKKSIPSPFDFKSLISFFPLVFLLYLSLWS